MVAHAEQAEAEHNNAKVSMEAYSKSMWEMDRQLTELRALNARMLLQNPQREQMLLVMSNMKLACNLAMNEAEQMQREVRRIAIEFEDGGQHNFGLTSWL